MMHPMVRKSLLLFGTIVLLTPHIVAAAFAVGDRVQATADLAVRSAATTSSPILRTIESPTRGGISNGTAVPNGRVYPVGVYRNISGKYPKLLPLCRGIMYSLPQQIARMNTLMGM